MSFAFGATSQAHLVGLHPNLVRVLNHAIATSPIDFTILEGVRSDEQCFINFGKGRNAAQCLAGGCPAKYAQPGLAKVTWLGHALSSNHRAKSDGFGHAVDVAPWPINWNDLAGFMRLKGIMFEAAAECGVTLRWGGDWNENGVPHEHGETDNPHFELA